jgi:hypothetical protein
MIMIMIIQPYFVLTKEYIVLRMIVLIIRIGFITNEVDFST